MSLEGVKISDFPLLPTFPQQNATIPVVQGGLNYQIGLSSLKGTDGEVLPPRIITVSTTTHSLSTTDKNNYLRFINVAAKNLSIPIVESNNTLIVTPGDIFTIRNAAVSDLTITSVLGVVTTGIAGSAVIAPFTTAQIMYVGGEFWDIL